jgi:hypothetical protein
VYVVSEKTGRQSATAQYEVRLLEVITNLQILKLPTAVNVGLLQVCPGALNGLLVVAYKVVQLKLSLLPSTLKLSGYSETLVRLVI